MNRYNSRDVGVNVVESMTNVLVVDNKEEDLMKSVDAGNVLQSCQWILCSVVNLNNYCFLSDMCLVTCRERRS